MPVGAPGNSTVPGRRRRHAPPHVVSAVWRVPNMRDMRRLRRAGAGAAPPVVGARAETGNSSRVSRRQLLGGGALLLGSRPGEPPPPSNPPPPSDPLPQPSSQERTTAAPQATLEALPTFNLRETGIWIHTFPGANDDERLSAAIAEQRRSAATENMPPMILPYRSFMVNPVAYRRTLYNGLKLIGPHKSGQKNPELAAGNLVGSEIVFTAANGSTPTPWWVGTGSGVFDVMMSDFSLQGSQGSGRNVFVDVPTGTLYACTFDGISSNFMYGMYGHDTSKCLVTQVTWRGDCTWNNCWGPPVHIGGSDFNFEMAMCNIGVSTSPVQTGTLNRYFIKLNQANGIIGGRIYITANNGWRGVLVSGRQSSVKFSGMVVEGFKPTGTREAGPAHGALVRQQDGSVAWTACDFGQAMAFPQPGERGLYTMVNGEVSFDQCTWYGQNMATTPAIDHQGGSVIVNGALRRLGEAWVGRPRYRTAATGAPVANGTAYSFHCSDRSMQRL
jgi:hypothetical protein